MMRDIIRQARHELGILRLLGECTLVPLALVAIVSGLLIVTGAA